MELVPVTHVVSDFQNFAWSNNILASTVGFTIGMATKDLIENMMRHAGVPTLPEAYAKITGKALSKGVDVAPTWSGTMVLLLLDILKWAGILLMSFIIATYVLQWLIGKAKGGSLQDSPHDASEAVDKKTPSPPQPLVH